MNNMKQEMEMPSPQAQGNLQKEYATTNHTNKKEHIISPLGALFFLLSAVGFIALFYWSNSIYSQYIIWSYLIISLVVMIKAFEYPTIKTQKDH